eukprot:1679939-Amphidinium_carterae.1
MQELTLSPLLVSLEGIHVLCQAFMDVSTTGFSLSTTNGLNLDGLLFAVDRPSYSTSRKAKPRNR